MCHAAPTWPRHGIVEIWGAGGGEVYVYDVVSLRSTFPADFGELGPGKRVLCSAAEFACASGMVTGKMLAFY